MPAQATAARRIIGLILWLGACFAAASFGALFLPGQWYAQLVKPAWTPPAWLFGPVWTLLYTLMAIAAWLVWKEGGFRARALPLGLFIAQLCLNAIWSPLCFGLHSLALSSVDILLLWGVLLLTLRAFFKARPAAGWLLVPYLFWVSYAVTLNVALWRLNP